MTASTCHEWIDTRADGAVLSPDSVYRYALVRRFDLTRSDALVWLMLNPSTADASRNDPTIRKCISFASRLGFGAIIVVNLYAFRTPQPSELKRARERGVDVVGPDNDMHITSAVGGRSVIAAWGASPIPMIEERIAKVRELCSLALSVDCLGLSESPPRQPRHPLMLTYERSREPFNWGGRAL